MKYIMLFLSIICLSLDLTQSFRTFKSVAVIQRNGAICNRCFASVPSDDWVIDADSAELDVGSSASLKRAKEEEIRRKKEEEEEAKRVILMNSLKQKVPVEIKVEKTLEPAIIPAITSPLTTKNNKSG